MVICDKCGKATRVKHAFVEEDGKMKKVRVCKCGAVLDKAYKKPSKSAPKAEEEAPKKRVRKAHREGRGRRGRREGLRRGNTKWQKKCIRTESGKPTRTKSFPTSFKKFGYKNVNEVPQTRKDRNEFRSRRHQRQREERADRPRRAQGHRRPEARHHPRRKNLWRTSRSERVCRSV